MRDDANGGRGGLRSCGDCRACCTVFDIPEFDKSRNELCAHADGSGCSIYSTRPERCRSFECAWKQGLAGDADRPDRLGVMLYLIPLTDGGPGLGAVEVVPGALARPRVGVLLGEFERRRPGRILARRALDEAFVPAQLLIEGKPGPGVESRVDACPHGRGPRPGLTATGSPR